MCGSQWQTDSPPITDRSMLSNGTASTSLTAEQPPPGGAKHVDLSARIQYKRCLDSHRREERRRARRKAREEAAAEEAEAEDELAQVMAPAASSFRPLGGTPPRTPNAATTKAATPPRTPTSRSARVDAQGPMARCHCTAKINLPHSARAGLIGSTGNKT